MDYIAIKGVSYTPLKIIEHSLGNILHGLQFDEASFKKFGEAYFSYVNYNSIKAWKKHKEMTLNLIVPHGEVKFVFFDDRDDSGTKGKINEMILGPKANYGRLTIEPGIWFGFMGMVKESNIVLNIANIKHRPDEALKAELDLVKYSWY